MEYCNIQEIPHIQIDDKTAIDLELEGKNGQSFENFIAVIKSLIDKKVINSRFESQKFQIKSDDQVVKFKNRLRSNQFIKFYIKKKFGQDAFEEFEKLIRQ